MLVIDDKGHVTDARVKLELRPLLERGPMDVVHGIIVHQTDASTAKSSLDAYKVRPIGAHFLIDKDGTIYQTASVKQRVNHVGKLRARCVAEHSCRPAEEKRINAMTPTARNRYEMTKSVPDRYPSNTDSIGIELVGKSSPPPSGSGDAVYESVTAEQNASLAWLISGLSQALKFDVHEVFRHPTASQKTPSEASTARW